MSRALREHVGEHNEFGMEVSWGGIRLFRRNKPGSPGVFVERGNGGGTNVGRPGLSTAGRVIKEFSASSRLHMRERFAALPWERCGDRLAMVTYTYPKEFPHSGRVVKGHREAMKLRWSRKWGAPTGAWALEFQDRGAPHIHTYVGLPPLPLQEFEDWIRNAWYEVVGSGVQVHRRRGVDVRPCFYGPARENARRVADYFWRESGKRQQKKVPDDYVAVGRFWGYWGLKPELERLALTVHEDVEIRRVMMALLRHRPGIGKVKVPKGFDGMWLRAEDGFWLAQVLREWARDVVEWKGAGGLGAESPAKPRLRQRRPVRPYLIEGEWVMCR